MQKLEGLEVSIEEDLNRYCIYIKCLEGVRSRYPCIVFGGGVHSLLTGWTHVGAQKGVLIMPRGYKKNIS